MKRIVLGLWLALLMACKPTDKGEEASIEAIIINAQEQAEQQATYGVITLDDLLFYKDANLKSYHPSLAINQQVRLFNKDIITINNRPYYQVETQTDPVLTGYVSSYFVAVEGVLAVVTDPNAPISANPESLKLTDLTLPPLAIVAIYSASLKNGYVRFDYVKDNFLVITDRYLKESSLSTADNHLTAALYYQLALNSNNIKLKEQYINLALEQQSSVARVYLLEYQDFINQYSSFYTTGVSLKTTAVLNKTTAAAFYAQPSTEAVMLTMLPKNSSITLNLIDKSNKGETIDGINNYWYLDRDRGWVFGSAITLKTETVEE